MLTSERTRAPAEPGALDVAPPPAALRRLRRDLRTGEAPLPRYLESVLDHGLDAGPPGDSRSVADGRPGESEWPAYLHAAPLADALPRAPAPRRDPVPAPAASALPAYLPRPAPPPVAAPVARTAPQPAPVEPPAPLPASPQPAPAPAPAAAPAPPPAPAAAKPGSPAPAPAAAPDAAAAAPDAAAEPAAEKPAEGDVAAPAAGGGGAPAPAGPAGEAAAPPPAAASSQLVNDPATPPEVVGLVMAAAELRERGEGLRADGSTHAANAAALTGNVGLMRASMTGAADAVQTAQGHLDYRRELVGQSRQALSASRTKAAEVAAAAPRGVTVADENKAKSGTMASESGNLARENASTNRSDDPEASAKSREQGGKLEKVGSDAASIDGTIGEAQAAANTLVTDAAAAAQNNDQADAGMAEVDTALGKTGAKIGEMQSQGAAAQASLEGLAMQPDEARAEAGKVGATGQQLIDSATGIEQRIEAIQQEHAARTAQDEAVPVAANASVPVESLPFADDAPVPVDALPEAADDAVPVDSLPFAPDGSVPVESLPFDAGAPVPVGALPLVPGEPVPVDALPLAPEQAPPDPAEERRQADLAAIQEQLQGREFSSLTAGERRSIALRTMVRGAFSGLGEISWPTPGGVARGVGHLAVGLIDPRSALSGVASGLGMIINAGATFGRDPSWSGALRLAANVATGLAVILGSITMLAGVIAALATAITLVTLGVAAPITGPIIAFCATVMSVVGGWTFWVGLIAAGLQALMFLVDLYKAGTAQTAAELQGHTAHMREDAVNAGNSLLQAGMGKLAQIGGRGLQGSIRAAGGGVRFAAQTGARFGASGSRALATVRAAGVRGTLGGIRRGAGNLGTRALDGARSLRGRVVEGARALPGRISDGAAALRGRITEGARALPGRIAEGASALPGRIAALPGRIAQGAVALPGRIIKGASTLGGRVSTGVREGIRDLRQGLSRDYAIGTDIARGQIRATAQTTRLGVYIDDLLTRGPLPGRVSPSAVARARAAVNSGNATPRDHRTLIEKALEDARDYNVAEARGAIQRWDVCAGRCGPGRDVSATSFGELASESPVPIGLRRFQAAEVFGVNKHGFNVVTVAGEPPTRYLVDPTFGQFMRPGGSIEAAATAEVLRGTPQGAAMARNLLRDGYIPLTDETAALYARAMGADEAAAAGLGARLNSPSRALTDEVIGGGANAARGGARPGPIMVETGAADIIDARESLFFLRDNIRRLEASANPDPRQIASLREFERRLIELHRRRGVPLPTAE